MRFFVSAQNDCSELAGTGQTLRMLVNVEQVIVDVLFNILKTAFIKKLLLLYKVSKLFYNQRLNKSLFLRYHVLKLKIKI